MQPEDTLTQKAPSGPTTNPTARPAMEKQVQTCQPSKDSTFLLLTANERFALAACGFAVTVSCTTLACLYRPELWVEIRVSFWQWQPYLWTGLAAALVIGNVLDMLGWGNE